MVRAAGGQAGGWAAHGGRDWAPPNLQAAVTCAGPSADGPAPTCCTFLAADELAHCHIPASTAQGARGPAHRLPTSCTLLTAEDRGHATPPQPAARGLPPQLHSYAAQAKLARAPTSCTLLTAASPPNKPHPHSRLLHPPPARC